MPPLPRTSYWRLGARTDRTDRAGGRPAATLHAEVAVVGGGITGLVTAAALAERGARVLVLEALDLAAGTTGGSTAKVAALHGSTYRSLEQQGAEIARGYAAANLAGVERLGRLVEAHGIDCGWQRQPAYTYTVEEERAGAIIEEQAAARRAGLPVELDDASALPFPVAAAVRCDDQAQLDPVRFCRGLASALERQGVVVHTHARVLAVREGPPHRLELDGAQVEADQVVLATQLPVHDPGLFFSRTTPSRSYALAASLGAPVPDGMYLSIDEPARSIRHVSGQRNVGIFGGPSHTTGEGGDTREVAVELEAWVRRHFDVSEVLASWSAQDRVPNDGRPFIGRMPRSAEGMFVATGFRKWGFSHAAVAGEVLAELATGGAHPWPEIFDSRRAPGSATAVGAAVAANTKVLGHFVGDRLRTIRPPSAERLEPGTGAVVEHEGTKVAAFRDDGGQLHLCSARCPHMGCLVAWNPAERSWDCPCHGSRFDLEGTVLDGPATVPLPPPS